MNAKSRGFEAVIAQLGSARRKFECQIMHDQMAMKPHISARRCINPSTLSNATSHHDRASEPTRRLSADSINTMTRRSLRCELI
jgi:hypothetical protein